VQPLHGRRKEIADAQRVHDDGERIYGLAEGPENGADHQSDEQVDALVAEEGRQRFGVYPHRQPDFQQIATILYLAFGCEFSAHVTSYCDDSQ
jgi:hypothetical protein